MDPDLDAFESALGYFMRVLARPRYWSGIQHDARVTIDRPSAHLLFALQQEKNGCKLVELAQSIGIEAPSVTRTVRRLEQAKYITRTVDPMDKRAICLHITQHGVRILRRIRNAKRKYLETLFADWLPSERMQLATMMRRLAEQVSETHS